VGSSNLDWVGWPGYVDVLANGNYVVRSPDWDNGAMADVGAATWGSRLTGVKGVITSTNSLIGGAAGDRVGDIGINQLYGSGNYLLEIPDWDGSKGAFAWGSGTAATTGTVSAANALVGSAAGDFVGADVTELSDGNYVLVASALNNSTGAVAWGDGSDGTAGVISNLNAFIGTTPGDGIGSGGIIDLLDGRFVVKSPDYFNGVSAAGRVDIYVPSGGVPVFNNPLLFGDSAGSDSMLHPNQITAILNTGTDVVLQANNDITVNSAIIANNGSGDGGDLTMTAGRSILIHADIFTDDGNLTLTANETEANGVVDAYRLGGLPAVRRAKIDIDNGAAVDVGAGTASLTLRYSDDKTYNDVSGINLNSDATLSGEIIQLLAEDGDLVIQDEATQITGHSSVLLETLDGGISLWNGARVSSPDITVWATGTFENLGEGGPAGVLDASGTAAGSITLLGESIYAHVIPGSLGAVSAQLTGAADDIDLEQPSGILKTSQYSFSAPAGSTITLLSPNDIQIDSSIVLPTHHLELVSTTDTSAVVTGNYNITAASLYVDAGFVVDSVDSVINAPATFFYGITVEDGGRLDLQSASEIYGVWLEGLGLSGLGARLNINHSGSSLMSSSYVNTGGVLTLPVGLNNLGPDFALDGGTLNNPNAIAINADYTWSAGTVAGIGSLSLAPGHTLTKTDTGAGPGTVTVQQAFNNNGTLDIQAGDVVLSGGGTHDGDFDIAAGSLLTLFGTHSTDSIFSGGGRVDVTGILNVERIAPGVPQVEIGANTTLNILGGNVVGGGNLINRGSFNVGPLSVAPRLTNYGNANLTDTVLTNGFINYGDLSLDGLVLANGSSEIADGTVDLNAGAELRLLGAPLSWSGGTFAGTGTLSFIGGGSFNFSGSGDRVLYNPNLAFVFSTLDFPAGSLTLRAGSLTIDTGTLAANRILTLDGGTLTNNTDLTVSGTFNLFDGIYNGAGDLSTTSTGIINMPAGSTVTWSNTGNLSNAGTLALSNTTFNGALTNASTGTMNLGPALRFTQTVNNAGTLNLVAGTTTFLNGLTQSSGSTRLNSGNLDGNVTLNGGTFGGIGTVTGDVNINNNVTLSPGASPGTLNIVGNLTLNPLSTTLIELGGTTQGSTYDFINVTGIATLDGALNVVLWGGYVPAVTTTFTPLMANAGITGTFATETLPALNNMAYSVIYNPLTVDVFYYQALAGLPPPVVQQIVTFENLLGLIGVQTPQTVFAGEGAAQDLTIVGLTDPANPFDALAGNNQSSVNSLFNELINQGGLQGWNDESRLVCR
jgi:hypothetical protein